MKTEVLFENSSFSFMCRKDEITGTENLQVELKDPHTYTHGEHNIYLPIIRDLILRIENLKFLCFMSIIVSVVINILIALLR